MLYYCHNLHFLAVAHALQGRLADARKATDKLIAKRTPAVKDIPELEGFMPTRVFIPAMFQRGTRFSNCRRRRRPRKTSVSLHHFARGLAFASTGKPSEAEAEKTRLLAMKPFRLTPSSAR